MPSPKKKPVSNQHGRDARAVLKMLIGRVREAEPQVSYGDVSELTGVEVCNLRNVLNHLSRTMTEYCDENGLDIPPLQVLIVNGKTKVPGPGASPFIREPFVKAGEQYNDLSLAEQRKVMQSVYKAIAAFKNWKKVEADLGKLL